MSYTDDEVRARVKALMQTGARVPLAAANSRDLDTAYDELQQLAATVFLLDLSAMPHLVRLSVERLRAYARARLDAVDTLIERIKEVGQPDFPVSDISSLSEAAAALRELNPPPEMSNLSRSGGYKKFMSATDQFLEEQRSNIVGAGQLRRTQQQARGDMATLLTDMVEGRTQLPVKVALVSEAKGQFDALRLANRTVQKTVDELTSQINNWITTLVNQTPSQRTERLRELALDLLTGRAAMTHASSLKSLEEFYSGGISLTPVADAAHPASVAELQATKAGPYEVPAGAVLGVEVDGATSVDVSIPAGQYAELDTPLTHAFVPATVVTGVQAQLFEFELGDKLELYLYNPTTGVEDYVYVETVFSGGATVGSVVATINNAITTAGLNARYRAISFNTDYVRVEDRLSDGFSKIVVGKGKANYVLGFTSTGGYDLHDDTTALLISRHAGTFNTIGPKTLSLSLRHPITKVDSLVSVTFVAGAARTANQIATEIQAAIQSAALGSYYDASALGSRVYLQCLSLDNGRIQVAGGNACGALRWDEGEVRESARSNLTFIADVPGLAGSPRQVFLPAGGLSAARLAVALAGLGPEFTCTPSGDVDARSVRLRYTGNAPAALQASMLLPSAGNLAASDLRYPLDIRVTAGPVTATDMAVRLSAKLPTWRVTSRRLFETGLARVRARTDPTDSLRAVMLRGDRALASAVSSGPSVARLTGDLAFSQVGDAVAVRDGVNAGSTWTVTAVDAEGIDVDTGGGITDGACTVEVGPVLPVVAGAVLEVLEGPNRGVYPVSSLGAVPFELVLGVSLPFFNTQESSYTFFAGYGKDTLVFQSKSTTTSSALRLTSAGYFFDSGTVVAAAGIRWVLLGEDVRGLQAGDTLDLRLSNRFTTTALREVRRRTGLYLEMSEVYPGLPAVAVAGSDAPLVLLRNRVFAQLRALREGLELWLSDELLGPDYDRELQRRLNFVLQMPVPTHAAIRDLVQWVTLWRNKIDDGLLPVLDAFSVPRSEAAELVLDAYRVRGAQRAIDILLEGRFQDFFKLQPGQLSYGAAALQGIQQAAGQLAIKSSRNRADATRSKLRVSAVSPDHEYDTSDATLAVRPDPPAGLMAPDAVTPDFDVG